MRRRILMLVLATTTFALTLLGVILVGAIWMATSSAAQDRAQATARVAAAALARQTAAGVPVDQANVEELLRDSATLQATLPDGRVIAAGPPMEPASFTGTATVGGVTVEAAIPTRFYVQRTAGQAALVVVISLVALVVAMVVALFYARRLTRPLEDFAVAAERIATGDRRPTAQRYGVPELDAVAEVLDRGVTSFNELLEAERRATTEASHQLRTPLTALSLRLEEIVATEDLSVAHVEGAIALEQVERLSGVIDEVVGANRGVLTASAERTEVDGLVRGQVAEWAPAYARAGRGLRAAGARGLVVEVIPGAQAQVLATLLENSLVHGAGVTTVAVRRAGDWVVLEVSDGGHGIPVELASRIFERHVSGAASSGLGLALARTIVAADGGRLELLSARPAVFAMFLPVTEDELAVEVPQASDALPSGSEGIAAEDQAVEWMAASSAASTSSGKTQRR